MNRAFPEMLQCSDMTVLERQRACLKWQQELQLHHHQQKEEQKCSNYFSELSGVFSSQTSHLAQGFHGGLMMMNGADHSANLCDTLMTRLVKPDPAGFETGSWPEFGPCGGYGNNGQNFDMNYAISRTYSCPPAVAAAVEVKTNELVGTEKMGSAVGRESFKKRKADKLQNPKVVVEDDDSKRIKACAEEGESKISNKSSSSNNNNKKETSTDTSKENSKVTEVQKPDYIHVRARRGQATDSHSLAERVRREKISERMKYLQDLVPGCNKTTGKAGMLDEIINYVQSLQRQVEFLSMKLAAVNPRLDFNIDNLFAKDQVFPTVGNMSSEMANPPYLQFNPIPIQQVVAGCGVEMPEMGINSHHHHHHHNEMALRRTISAPVSLPDSTSSFLDTSCFTQIQASGTWDVELQNLYNVGFDQGRSTPFPSQPFTGSIEASDVKMEL